MPPPMSRSSLSSLALRPSCLALSLTARAFSTSSIRSKIGPESPKFIDVPRTIQPHAINIRDIKGTLPPPRHIFPRRGANKTSTDYLANATPEPTAAHQLSEPQNDRIAWKRRMAASRRRNLREGLVELYARKQKNDRVTAWRSQEKRNNRERRVAAPIREDERLTATTITAANRQLLRGHVPDPNREARLAASSSKVQAKAEEAELQRRDALHTLYMHAREFIVTEEQLDQKIEELFVELPYVSVVGQGRARNIWDGLGVPVTVAEMLSEVSGTQKSAIQYHSGKAIPYQQRLRKIAEELTGGKMDDKI